VKVGIIGLPNAGKSTLFNALTSAGAETGEYPFTTIDPNVAVVPVPDERLPQIAATVGATELVPQTISFADIAGLVRGASEGEGLGNRFLAAIRETDAICHVVRCHDTAGVAHTEGRIDPVADAALVEAELCAADLEQAQARLERVTKDARSGSKEAVAAERDWLEVVVDGLAAGRPVREFAPPAEAHDTPARLQALTSKPMLYVANVSEGVESPPADLVEHARRAEAGIVAISARVEAELGELDDAAEAAELRAELGLGDSGLERLVRAAFDLLDLITFFTAHEGAEATARSLRRGSTASDAAGRVHTDFQAQFVRAEVIGWQDLVELGGYAAARERGKLRTEGREYVVSGGDVLTFKI
jgi:GTP-binding protein YchF